MSHGSITLHVSLEISSFPFQKCSHSVHKDVDDNRKIIFTSDKTLTSCSCGEGDTSVGRERESSSAGISAIHETSYRDLTVTHWDRGCL